MKHIFYAFLLLLGTAPTLFAQNATPTPVTDNYTVLEDLPFPLTPLSNDTDPDSGQTLTWQIVTGIIYGPFNGTIDTIFGTVVYRPDPDYFGPDIITYRACDDGTPVKCKNANIIINVVNINDPPEANNDTFTVNEDASIVMNILANDRDPDFNPLYISSIPQHAANGVDSVTPNKRMYYKPNPNFNGYDEIVYRLCDTAGGIFTVCDNGRVFIIVKPINDAPIANPDTIIDIVTDDSVVITNVLANDVDVDGDVLTLVGIISGNDSTTFVFDSTGNVRITSAPCGKDSFYYVMTDGHLFDTTIVYVTIICPPVPPLPVEDLFLTEGFSPDGNGINDRLVFKGIDHLRPAGLKIFNRYGNIVYLAEDYQNDWDGTANDSGQPLPDGTYFYVLQLSDGKSYPNYLVIQR